MIVLHVAPVLMSVRLKLLAKETFIKLILNCVLTVALALMYVPLKQSAQNRVGKLKYVEKAASKRQLFFYNFDLR